MKKSIYGLSLLAATLFTLHARLPFTHVMTFFIIPAPFLQEDDAEAFTARVTQPGRVASKIAHSVAKPSSQGIFATYGGYLVISDPNGQITFPRMQQTTKFTLIITEKIEPIFMLGNTIHHWTLLNIPTAIYSLEAKQDEATKLYYWDVKPAPRPQDTMIPLNSIVIFAKPKNIIVPTGITITPGSPHLFLPALYSVKNINDAMLGLTVLSFRQFFGPLMITNKKENNTYYSTQIINTQ